ncbi:tyrosine-type recombinase/integrase [Flavivirga spongiicola]|uniref:Site-specific integrase n=1 Tax=Flavivirga spongiicola TaxID=421621 RepID=A0ABU7XTU7_9FLAO|nr:phage integrase SAM-like domain-containing protein [Flavivirga sp. MEBiC05379]MDO5979183.1 phage integrase SAM-like domain-containing protein [Flavivirga sp. MEBiC05379]
MATVNFLYRSTRDNEPLNVRLLFRYEDIDYSKGAKTKLHIYTHDELSEDDKLNAKFYWKKLHSKKNVKDIDLENKQTKINAELNKIKNYILKKFNEENISEVINDKDWLKKTLEFYYNPIVEKIELPNELLNYFDYYLDEKKNSLANQTLKNYNVVKKLLIRYENSVGYKIKILDIDLSFKNQFEKYCLEQGYANNTISRAIHSVKTICLHARYNGLETSYQLEKVKLKEVKVENIYLSFDDLEKIEKADLNAEYLINARDWLIISCYLGQRISDLLRFNSNDIREEKGKPLIEFTQKKTGKIMTVPLHPKVIEVLKKKNGEFPRTISEQKYNSYIKTVCQEAKLKEKVKGSKKVETFEGSKKYRKLTGIYEKWELVSSHIGRRSFATNFYGKIPTSYLIYVTGHSTEKMFLSYIGKSNKDLAMEITNYF